MIKLSVRPRKTYNRKKGELILEYVTVGIETLQINYADKLDEWRQEIGDTVSQMINGGYEIASGQISLHTAF